MGYEGLIRPLQLLQMIATGRVLPKLTKDNLERVKLSQYSHIELQGIL